jgi:hypothetical protein
VDEADELRAAGYEPVEPYPGTVVAQWLSRCVTCGAERRPTLRDVRRRGIRCAHRGVATSPASAALEAFDAGFDPLESYPGTLTTPWRMRCSGCGVERTPTLKAVRAGWQCKHKYSEITQSTTPEEGAAELRSVGYDPLVPYPGKTKEPWRVRCMACGMDRTTTLNRLRSGERCKHQKASFDRRPSESNE